jgi:hypothetical protein
MKYLSQRPPVVDSADLTASWATRIGLKEPADYAALERAQWICAIGKSDSLAFFINPQKMPDASYDALLYHFYCHFSADESPIEFFIDCKDIIPSFVDKISRFLQSSNQAFIARIKRVYLLLLSVTSAESLQRLEVPDLAAKVRIVDDLEKLIQEDRIFLSPKYFDLPQDNWGFFPVTSYARDCRLYASTTAFYLKSMVHLFGKDVPTITRIPFHEITRIDNS